MYDLLVAGAGIAGLHVATSYVKKHPNQKLLLVERNSYLGGRIYTHHQHVKGKEYQWEAGAGRIPLSHKRIIGLIKEYGLTFQKWSAPPNLVDPFPDLIPVFLEPLQGLSPAVLAENTLADLLRQIHGPAEANRFMALFPYWAEFHTLRADLALEAFLRGPLGGQGGKGWGGCAEGLSALVERMGADIEARGGVIQKGVSVLEVRPLGRDQVKQIHLRPACSVPHKAPCCCAQGAQACSVPHKAPCCCAQGAQACSAGRAHSTETVSLFTAW